MLQAGAEHVCQVGKKRFAGCAVSKAESDGNQPENSIKNNQIVVDPESYRRIIPAPGIGLPSDSLIFYN